MTFRMCLTNEDHLILQFVESYGSITISQCRNMFYSRQIKGYEMSRLHLSKLCGYLKLNCFRDANCNKNVYYINKKPTYHGVLALDYLSELIKNGAFIHHFKQEQSWMDRKYFSDAYCCFSIGGRVYFNLVEVVRSKNVETEKYINIYDSKEAHILSDEIYKQLGGSQRDLFPHLIIIDDVRHKNDLYVNEKIKVIQLDFKLTNLVKIFL